MDPWAHYHPLGGAKLTFLLSYLPKQPTYLHATTIQEPSIAIGWQGGVGDNQLMPPASPPPHLRLQVPLCPLHTINGAMELGGDHHSAALKHSKCSKLLEALQE